VTQSYTRYSVPGEVLEKGMTLEVTLLDAVRIKEIILLVVSFLIRETHNKYILVNADYTADNSIDPNYY
jgi:hypothetical protein